MAGPENRSVCGRLVLTAVEYRQQVRSVRAREGTSEFAINPSLSRELWLPSWLVIALTAGGTVVKVLLCSVGNIRGLSHLPVNRALLKNLSRTEKSPEIVWVDASRSAKTSVAELVGQKSFCHDRWAPDRTPLYHVRSSDISGQRAQEAVGPLRLLLPVW